VWIPDERWRFVSAAQMRAADTFCIQELGIPGAVLMYNAGRAVFAEVSGGPVGIVCGKGNNGGDGFVVGLLAHAAGLNTRVVVLAAADDLRGDAKTFHDAYVKLGGAITHATTEDDATRAVADLAGSATLVDAILGTGFAGEVRGLAHAAITAWPVGRTVAVDLPSGLDADTGQARGACIRAEVTVTFQAAKAGFRAPEALRWLGRVRVADIGIPDTCFR